MNPIKNLRKKRGLSQLQLANAIHVHQTAVSQWETGKTHPDMSQAIELASYFGVTTDYVLGLSGDTMPLRKEKANPQSELTDIEIRLIGSFRAVKSERIRQAVIDILEDSVNPATTNISLDSKAEKKYGTKK